MKKIVFLMSVLFTIILTTTDSEAQVRVNGYYNANGTYVQPYTRSSPNGTNRDNYSTSPNYNPYTGSQGYVAPDYSQGAYNYGQGQQIYTGSRGGQYYYNSNGNKVYVPKRGGR